MSSFCANAVNPQTGDIDQALFLDMSNGTYEVSFPDGDSYPGYLISIIPEDAEITDSAYEPLPSDPLNGCAWLCGKFPVCSCGDFASPSVYCRKCGHEADCHETGRFAL